MTSGIKVGNLHIGAGYPTNGPVIWSETGLTIQGSNGIVGIPRNNLYVGGNVGIGKDPTQYALDVNGSIYASVDVLAQSDIRVKTNIVEIDSPLEKILKMRGVYYNRRDDSNTTPARHVGVIAQEVEEVLPEVVSTDTSEARNKSVAYGNIVALLIEAVKAQQSTIDSLLLTR
jgi:ribosomal protein L27